nr:MAG: hypothetical protein DIU75_20985 [Mycolicibacterium hassiacum]
MARRAALLAAAVAASALVAAPAAGAVPDCDAGTAATTAGTGSPVTAPAGTTRCRSNGSTQIVTSPGVTSSLTGWGFYWGGNRPVLGFDNGAR